MFYAFILFAQICYGQTDSFSIEISEVNYPFVVVMLECSRVEERWFRKIL
jgi:hypothetical protein